MPDQTFATKPDEDALEIERLGDYRVVRELGQGGMGIVYHARQISLDRDVALKVIRPQLALNTSLMARFKREYTVHAGLSHPNIVKFYDAGESDGLTFYAMEYLDAEPLDEVVKDREATQEFTLVARVAEALAASLGYLHPKGILHRDIKPGNVMLERGTGRVVLMDFGLVKPKNHTALTREGRTVGSPRYMAPEMLDGRKADARADIYQVGITLYQLATGKLPFDGADLVSLAAAIIGGRHKTARRVNPTVTEALDNLIENCIARDLEDRYQDAEELARDVKRLRAGLPVALLKTPPEGAVPSESHPSLSQSVPGQRSTGIPRLSSTSMAAERPGSGGLPLGPLLGVGILASLVPLAWAFLGTGDVYRAQDLEVTSGVRAALVRWKGTPAYPSRVVVEPVDGTGAPQTVMGSGPDAEGRHDVLLEGLEPGVEYVVKVFFPDGRESLPRRVAPPLALGPILIRQKVRYTEEGVELQVVTNPACQVSIRYRREGKWEERRLSDSHVRELTARLPAPGLRGEFSDVSLELEAVGARTVVELPPIRGALGRLHDLVDAVQALDMESLMERLREVKAEEDPEGSRALARSLVQIPDIDEYLAILEEHAPFDPLSPFTWDLYRALRRLESVDAWLENNGLERVHALRELYAPLIHLSWPEDPGDDGISLVDVEPGEVTSLAVQGGSQKDRMILSIYSATSTLEHVQGHEGDFRLDAAPDPAGRAAAAVRVRNLSPETLIKIVVNGSRPIELTNSREAFKGFYWHQIRGGEMGELWGATNWIVATFPARLLRKGENRWRLWADIHEGLHPTHYIDLYDARLWPAAPARFPGS